MAWVYLVCAGLLEVFWATCMKFSEGFTVLKFSVLTIIGMIFSFLLLAHVMKQLPLGTAYAIWTGIGALGSVIVGIILFKEAATPSRLLFVALILTGIIGLKLTSASS
ncbi:MAG TPA: multidrug efflux SMR transporter [Candidatus Copromorpha excrementigallinarum]|uniref:Multidrug efflux SMR transporter n=1 Tax=Candidatus Allocopromorpha excrementigallinarum TaxID=2840742 RepID=A0A9D1L4Z5_9FIRM|nr:multidrug efflux SMR transporter [Candidatus Copromorpha excrementigallinarum]